MEDLKNILKEIIQITSDSKLLVTPDCLLENAVKIFISNNIAEQRNEKKMNFEDKEEPATSKQLYLLKKLKVEIPKNLTIKEASQLIKEIKEKTY